MMGEFGQEICEGSMNFYFVKFLKFEGASSALEMRKFIERGIDAKHLHLATNATRLRLCLLVQVRF